MRYEILNATDCPIIQFNLDDNQSIKIESGSMIYKDEGIILDGKMNGSIFKALTKSVVGNENMFITTATSSKSNQKIGVAPRGIGSLHKIDISSTQWYLEDGVYLASTGTIEYDIKRQKGLGNAFFGGTGGFFIIKTSGIGELFVESFGSIIELYLDGVEPFYIDNSHIVGWEETLSHSIEFASGTFGFKSGEGLVTCLRGSGKVLIQTRQVESFAKKMLKFLPNRK